MLVNNDKRRIKLDTLIAMTLIMCVFLLGFYNLDNNCNWGDDFAAYINDGIAIAEGRWDEQIRINLLQREGPDADIDNKVHVHAFGFPLVHALTYSLVGFDRVNFNNLWMYKLPSLIAFALMAGVFYLFLRRRLSCYGSIFGVAFLCFPISFYTDIRNLYNDVIYLALSTGCFYMAEVFFEKKSKEQLTCGILLALLMWAAYSTRLNGATILAAVLLGQIVSNTKKKTALKLSELLPWCVFLLLYFIFNILIFPKPTSTSSLI